MGRSRRASDSIADDLWHILRVAPSWLGPVIAALVYVLLQWFIPWSIERSFADQELMEFANSLLPSISKMIAPWFAGLVIFAWLLAEFAKFSERKKFDRLNETDKIRDLDWPEFERMVSEAFRRQGYNVDHLGGPNPDGGVDQRLRKDGQVTLVQCKHWKQWKVGVQVVRELLGVVTCEGAQSGIVVTSGRFTQEARDFARKANVRLIDGPELLRMFQEVQTEIRKPVPDFLICPKCQSEMVLRTATKGQNAGNQIWGCSRFPTCRGTRVHS